MYIPCIYHEFTGQVLIYQVYTKNFRILALVDVDAQGASGAINSREALEEGVAAGTSRNIPGIFQVYSRYIPNPGPWTSC